MYIDRILAPIETLGPGNRLVIWVKGCSKKCKGCANPELWSFENSKSYSVDDIFKIIQNIFSQNRIDGVTISGGDPLEQKEQLLVLLKKLNALTQDILVYTGYTMDELNRLLSQEEMMDLENYIAVLIDVLEIGDQKTDAYEEQTDGIFFLEWIGEGINSIYDFLYGAYDEASGLQDKIIGIEELEEKINAAFEKSKQLEKTVEEIDKIIKELEKELD